MNTKLLVSLLSVGMALGFLVGLLVCDFGHAQSYPTWQDLENQRMMQEYERKRDQQYEQGRYQPYGTYKNPC